VRRRRELSDRQLGVLFLLPFAVLSLGFVVYPALDAIRLAFHSKLPFRNSFTFVGLDNFRYLRDDPVFWAAAWQSCVWTGASIVLQTVFGVAIALLLHQAVRGINVFRGLLLFPYMVPTVVIALIWRWMFNPELGIVNAVLNNWVLGGVHNWSSGNPLNFTMGTDVALDGTNGAGRQLAQLAQGKTVADIRRNHSSQADFIAAFFDKSAFAPVTSLPRGIYGNVPKSAISGPAQGKTDIAVSRLFSIPGRQGMRLQFRGELFNAFNQVNFDIPGTTQGDNRVAVNSANFGRIFRTVPVTGDPRLLQFGLKFVF